MNKPKNLKAVVFCKDCKHYYEDVWERIDGIPFIAAHEVCTFWGNGCKTSEKSYCSYGELRSNENKHSDSSGNNTNSIKDNGNG